MKKKFNKGFMLLETLIVTTFVAGTLIFLFIQFSNLNRSYELSFKYNNVDKLYALKDVSEYIKSDNSAFEIIKNELNTKDYYNMTGCADFSNKIYCEKLLQAENIEKIIVTKQNLANFKDYSNLSQETKDFIKIIKYEDNNSNYRLITEFNDNTYATLEIKN